MTKIIKAGYAALQLEYFFTAGPDEVRAWTVRVRPLLHLPSARYIAASENPGHLHLPWHLVAAFVCSQLLFLFFYLYGNCTHSAIWMFDLPSGSMFNLCSFRVPTERHQGTSGSGEDPHRLWERLHHGWGHEVWRLQGGGDWERCQGGCLVMHAFVIWWELLLGGWTFISVKKFVFFICFPSPLPHRLLANTGSWAGTTLWRMETLSFSNLTHPTHPRRSDETRWLFQQVQPSPALEGRSVCWFFFHLSLVWDQVNCFSPGTHLVTQFKCS